MKRSDNYAGNQIRLFLGDLKIGNHASKLKALQKFQSYIEQNKPEISDDNVEFLFTGVNSISGTTAIGLLSHCGLDSDKHAGQLKRICGPLISFVNWLINPVECGDEVYLATFTRLSAEELVKINFPKHILNQTESKITLNLQGQTRGGSSDDAFSLLQVLYTDHRTIDDEPDPIDIGYLLRNNKVCMEKFAAWMQRSNFDFVTEELANRGKKLMSKVIARPSRWEDVQFRAIPLQEGEDVGSAEVDEGPVVPPPILDPLRLREVDLRETQEVFATGGLEKRMLMNRRASDASALRPRGTGGGNYNASQVMSLLLEDDDDDNDNDNDNEEQIQQQIRAQTARVLPSVIPSDKSFSISLFLSLVHGGTSFDELNTGLQNLHSHLKEQSTRRVNLVRNHFGLFSQCAEGLEWLRDFRRGVIRQSDLTPIKDSKQRLSMTPQSNKSTPTKVVPIDKFMENFKRAQGTLELAKVEAKNTLAPILERMKQVREIKSAEKVLKGMSTLLDYPRSMKTALDRGELKDCVAIYHRIKDIPTAMKLTNRIKNTAENIIFDLKKASLTQLFTPSVNGSLLLRHALIFLDIDKSSSKGRKEFLQLLRYSFLRQLTEFIKVWKELRDRFIFDCVEAYDKGQEMNLMIKNSSSLLLDTVGNNSSSSVAGGGNESVLNIARRYYTANNTGSNISSSNKQKRPSVSAYSNNSNNNSPRPNYGDRRPSTSSMTSTIMLNRRPSLNSQSLDHTSNYGEDDILIIGDEPNLNLQSQKNDFFLTPDNNNSSSTINGSLESLLSEFEAGMDSKDYSEFFIMLVRRSYADYLLDYITKWFSCLFLLSCEYLHQTQNLGSTYQDTQNLGRDKKSGFSGVNKSPNLGVTSPLKLLGMTLMTVMDQLQQVVNGMKPTFQNSTSSSSSFVHVDVITAIHEFELELPSLTQAYNLSLAGSTGSNELSLLPMMTSVNSSSLRFNDIITNHNGSYIFSTPLKLTVQQEEVLQEAYQLHEAMEIAFTQAKLKFMKMHSNNSKTAYVNGSAVATGYRPFATNNNNTTQQQDNMSNQELEVTSPLSPFHESFAILTLLAKESETVMTTKLLDKLLTKCHLTTETLLFESDLEVLYQLRLFSVSDLGSLNSPSIGVELTVIEFEFLASKGIDALRSHIHRIDWINQQLLEFFLVRMTRLTLLEKYRRKLLFIEDSSSSSTASTQKQSLLPTAVTTPTRNSLMMTMKRRQSTQFDQLTLISLEDELRSFDIGFELPDIGSTTSKSKNTAYLDFLRGLIRLRSYTLPKMLKKLSRVFAIDYSRDTAPMTATAAVMEAPLLVAAAVTAAVNKGAKEESSLISRLFTSASTTADTALKGGVGSDDNNRRNRRMNLETPNSTIVNPSTNNTQNMSFHEKIMFNWLDHYFREFGDLNSTFFGTTFLKPLLTDMIKMEAEVVKQYLQYRQVGLKGIVFASYSYLVEQELQLNLRNKAQFTTGITPASSNSSAASTGGSQQLPTHTSRVIMALHEEKKMLNNLLGGLSLDDHGINYHLYKTQQQAADDDHTDSEDDNPSSNTSNKKNGYATYLYQQLCRGLLEVYEELIQKLYSGSMGSLQQAAFSTSGNATTTAASGAAAPPMNPFKQQTAIGGNASSASTGATSQPQQQAQQLNALPVKTILQAVEEWEFLKLVLRPILVDLQVLQKVVLSPAEMQLIFFAAQKAGGGSGTGTGSGTGSGAVMMNREELLQAGQILMILVQQT